MKRKKLLLIGLSAVICLSLVACNSIIKSESESSNSDNIEVSSIYNVSNQEEIRKDIDKQIENGSYDEENALMLYNPFHTNTLSMYFYFTTDQPAKISYTIHVDDSSIEDFTQTLNSDYATTHEYQLIGLIPDMENTITLHLEYEDGSSKDVDYTYTCGSLRGVEEVQLEKETGESTQEVSDGLYVVLGNDSENDDFMYYYDNNGTIRGEIPIIGYRSHRLLFNNDKMYFSVSQSKMVEMDALGQITNIFDLGDYDLHHDYVFDDNGDILILATDTTKTTVEDMIIRLNVSTGSVDLVCDLGDLFPTYKSDIVEINSDDNELDWMHLNTIQYMGDDQILVSSRETSTIIKIKNISTEPEIDYMLGEETYWEGSDYEQYLFDKENNFVSQTGQHSITYVEDDSLEDGQYYLYMFNNNFGKSSTNPSYDWKSIGVPTETDDETATSYYYKYLVDEKNNTYELVESFEVPYSPYVSSAQQIDDTIIVDSGIAFNFQEYDSNNELIQSFTMEGENYLYRVYKYTFDDFYFNK